MDPGYFIEFDIYDADGKIYERGFSGTFETAKAIAWAARGYVTGVMRSGTPQNGGECSLMFSDFRKWDGGDGYSDRDLPALMVHVETRTHFFDGMACALLKIGLPDTNVEFCFGYEKGVELRKKFEDLIK